MDLEWNEPLSSARRNRALQGDIIEIGAVKTDENMREIDTFFRMIQPSQYKKITKRITSITTVKDEDVMTGISFEEAVKDFKEWCGDDCIWLTWSNSDEKMLRNNLAFYGLDDDWIPYVLDAQLMFDEVEMGDGRCYPLNYTFFYFDIKPEASHNALNDSINTAEVIRRIDYKEWIEEEIEYLKRLESAEFAEDDEIYIDDAPEDTYEEE